jgi:glutamate-1-semialdehyde 2,1-aminomutase
MISDLCDNVMENTAVSFAIYGLGAATTAVAFIEGKSRLALSRAKHPSLVGHSRMSRGLAGLIPFYEFDDARYFSSDGAPAEVVAARRAGFDRLSAHYAERYTQTIALKAIAKDSISDLQFTDAYRVPFQYSRLTYARLGSGPFLQSSSGVLLTDVDGNQYYDVAGSYGVNVFGYDFYKTCMAEGAKRAEALGPVLGAYHPSIVYNVKRLREISGLDEVSFHMSGTEAVMQAVRLARYHTRRSHLVRFCGAYHGWWGDVQPGIGNPIPARETYTLSEMSEQSLRVLRTRKNIACVLINPLQALHPNAPAPSDGALVDNGRKAGFDRVAYADWLRKLRDVCSERGIVLIFDEVFLGFRIAPGGAQEYFGVKADMVTYGKTLGGGYPVGVVCGRREFMKRYRDDRPVDICFARGTFNSHPYIMGAMQEFLQRLETPQIRSIYERLDAAWLARETECNRLITEAQLPVSIRALSSIWTVCYDAPSRYNWMLQYYLRREGLALSWVGTGRLIFSLNYTDADFTEVCRRFVTAVKTMRDDGWFWTDPSPTAVPVKRQIFREMLATRFRVTTSGAKKFRAG